MVEYSKFSTVNGFYSPQRFEAEISHCDIQGEIPKELDGAFIRVGSQWAFPPMFKDDVPFNEDGYVSRFRIKDGKCSYKGRWIRTERYENNLKAGRQLYGYYRNPYTDDPSVRDPEHPQRRCAANTATLAYGGRLFALKEDGLPHEIDPCTLDTLRTWDFGGKYSSPTFTAHPKIDPVTGDLYCYGYEATGLASDDLWVYVIDPAGQVKHEMRLKVPYVSMLHDIALTEEHIVFPVFPYVTSKAQLEAGKIHWAWDASTLVYYGIIPRDGSGEVRWFKGPTRAIVHTLNARTEGTKVILDAPIFDGNPFPFFPSIDASPWDPVKGRAFFRRITFDLASSNDDYTEEIIFPDRPITDLVRLDDRYLTKPYRYGFASFADASRPFDRTRIGEMRRGVNNCYGRFDMIDRQFTSYFAGPTHSLQEVCFIPRTPDAPEGDGFIIGVANNLAEMRSELIVADASNLEGGDLARVILPFRSDVQVHGSWYTANELPQLANDTPGENAC